MALLDEQGGNTRCQVCGAIECEYHSIEQAVADEVAVKNQYGEPATHADCVHGFDGKCQGEMTYYESYAGNTMLMCIHHNRKAYLRQDGIRRDYGLGIRD